MFAGHFALAAGVKSQEPAVPLWSVMVATQFLDVVFVPLYLTGVETIVPVGAGGYGGGIIHANYTHSLLGALVLSSLVLAVGAKLWGRRGGLVLGAVAFSHWLLDLLVHRADLPLLPGNWGQLPTLGFSLWQYPVLTAGIELAMIVVGTVMYGLSLRNVVPPRRPAAWLATSLMGVFLLASLACDWTGFLG